MIKQIIEEMRQQQLVTKKELVDDPRTLNSQLGNIKRAEENLLELFMALRDAIRKNSIFILVKGKESDKFSQIADEAFGCISVRADSIFKTIANKVDDLFLKNIASPEIFDIAMSSMSDLSHEIGILGYNHVQFKNDDAVFLKDRSDLEKLIANAFNREIGAELVMLNAIHEAALIIRDSEFEGNKVPIIIHSTDEELINKIELDGKNVSNNIFLVKAKNKQTESTVEKQLTQINERVRKG